MALRPVSQGCYLAGMWVMLAGVAGGWLLYHVVEQPCMRRRAAWFPLIPDGGTARTT
jgi:peptidoglycan/LPS O-acetylase OafA/YrhL